MLEGRQRALECICSHLGEMGARTSMKKFILERKKPEEVQAASSGGRHALSDYSWREGGVERGVLGLGTEKPAAVHRRREERRARQGAGRTGPSW